MRVKKVYRVREHANPEPVHPIHWFVIKNFKTIIVGASLTLLLATIICALIFY